MEYLKSTLNTVSESIQPYLPNRLLWKGGPEKELLSQEEKQPTERPLIEEGQSARSSFKQYVLDIQDHWQTNLFPLYTKEGVPEKELKTVHTRIDNAIQWFRSHPNPHHVDVLREKNVFIEDIEQLKKRIDQNLKESKELAAKKENESFASSTESSNKPSKKLSKGKPGYSAKTATPYQVFMKALGDIMSIAFRVLFIYFVLRLASISANDCIHKNVFYRLHAFFYTCVLFAYTIPYHIFRYIMYLLGKWNQPYIIEAGIPLKEVQSPISNIFYSIFNWYRHPQLANWIQLQKERETEMRMDALNIEYSSSSLPLVPPAAAPPPPPPPGPGPQPGPPPAAPQTPPPTPQQTPPQTPQPQTPQPQTPPPTPRQQTTVESALDKRAKVVAEHTSNKKRLEKAEHSEQEKQHDALQKKLQARDKKK